MKTVLLLTAIMLAGCTDLGLKPGDTVACRYGVGYYPATLLEVGWFNYYVKWHEPRPSYGVYHMADKCFEIDED